MGFVSNELTLERAGINFTGILIKYVCKAADFLKVGYVRFATKPQFKRGATKQGRRGG